MTADEGQSAGRTFAESYIMSCLPAATGFSWAQECTPPNLDFDFDIVSFHVGGVLMQLRLRCDALDENDEAEIRGWVNAQLRGQRTSA